MFDAELGGGAFLNGQPITVSKKPEMPDAIVGTDLSYDGDGAANGLDVIRGMWPGFQALRVMGSAALGIAYTAAGRHDLYFHHRLEPWDQVAGILLVREAGGVVTDRNGDRAGLDSDGLIASNAALHEEFLRLTDGTAWREPSDGDFLGDANDSPFGGARSADEGVVRGGRLSICAGGGAGASGCGPCPAGPARPWSGSSGGS